MEEWECGLVEAAGGVGLIKHYRQMRGRWSWRGDSEDALSYINNDIMMT